MHAVAQDNFFPEATLDKCRAFPSNVGRENKKVGHSCIRRVLVFSYNYIRKIQIATCKNNFSTLSLVYE